MFVGTQSGISQKNVVSFPDARQLAFVLKTNLNQKLMLEET